ncbi:MAG TPA: glycoside hydrolase TIM-barrel-like domain-containing protein [Candidatus Eisenbacteria bacterium]
MIRRPRDGRLGVSLAALLLAGGVVGGGRPAPPPREPLLRGVCLAHIHRRELGYGSDRSRATLEELRGLGVTWISLTPFGYQPTVHEPRILFRGDRSLSDSGLVREVRAARAVGLHAILKPHIWGGDFYEGRWPGDIAMPDDAAWDAWFQSYEAFILHFARVAETAGADAFCVGCELVQATRAHPERWRRLIAEVRAVYHGKLTYAANWYDEYDRIPFWDALDWIGVNAYFSLSKEETPSASEIARAWERVAPGLEAVSRRYGRPIVLTEVGFRSVDHAAANPHDWPEFDPDPRANPAAQAAAYEGTFQALWGRPWLRGFFWWKYYTMPGGEGPEETDFTPRGKPAERVMARYYGAPDPAEAALDRAERAADHGARSSGSIRTPGANQGGP